MTNENKNKMRNTIIGVVGIAVLLVGFYFISENIGDRSNDKKEQEVVYTSTTNPLLVEGEQIKSSEQKEVTEITFEGIKQALSAKENKFVFLGSPSCGWCNYQKPVLQYVMHINNVDTYYLDTSTLTNETYNELISLNESLKGFGTPTFITLEDGKITNVDGGARGISATTEMLKKYNIIK
ncbi:MAG: hypothetical protein E7168_04890 [Firmicutes bacterium]|nr:hypothetical protein [Bacillota bacterium]